MYIGSVWDLSPIIHDRNNFVQRRGDEKMHQFHVQFHSLGDVQDFVTLASCQKYRLNVGSEHFQVNATSFMGLFTLNCRDPQQVTVECSDEEFQVLLKTFERFLA